MEKLGKILGRPRKNMEKLGKTPQKTMEKLGNNLEQLGKPRKTMKN